MRSALDALRDAEKDQRKFQLDSHHKDSHEQRGESSGKDNHPFRR